MSFSPWSWKRNIVMLMLCFSLFRDSEYDVLREILNELRKVGLEP